MASTVIGVITLFSDNQIRCAEKKLKYRGWIILSLLISILLASSIKTYLDNKKSLELDINISEVKSGTQQTGKNMVDVKRGIEAVGLAVNEMRVALADLKKLAVLAEYKGALAAAGKDVVPPDSPLRDSWVHDPKFKMDTRTGGGPILNYAKIENEANKLMEELPPELQKIISNP